MRLMLLVMPLLLVLAGSALSAAPTPSLIRLGVGTPPDSPEPYAYGISVKPPWADGGELWMSFPEHLEYRDVGMGISRYSDKRPNAWVVEREGKYAHYEVDSLSAAGVKVEATAEVMEPDRIRFAMTIINGSRATNLEHVKPLLCGHYKTLTGFPQPQGTNFKFTYVVVGGRITPAIDLPAAKADAMARGAAIKPYPPYRTHFTANQGGWTDTPLDLGISVITSEDDKHALILYAPDGESFLSNRYIPCLHCDPWFGDIKPGERRTGTVWAVFAGADWRDVVKKLIAEHKPVVHPAPGTPAAN